MLIVERVHANRRVSVRETSGAVASVSLDVLDPQVRLRLFSQGEAGLAPVAVWLNEDGLPRQAHGWQHTFTTANARIVAHGLAGFGCSAHRLRHSFALRWYSVGKLLYDARFAHLDGEGLRDFRVQFGDTWQLACWPLSPSCARPARICFSFASLAGKGGSNGTAGSVTTSSTTGTVGRQRPRPRAVELLGVLDPDPGQAEQLGVPGEREVRQVLAGGPTRVTLRLGCSQRTSARSPSFRTDHEARVGPRLPPVRDGDQLGDPGHLYRAVPLRTTTDRRPRGHVRSDRRPLTPPVRRIAQHRGRDTSRPIRVGPISRDRT